LLIWLVAFLLRLILTRTGRVVWGDEPFYLWLGRNWATGKGYSFIGHADVHHGPLYPWLAGLLYLVTHDLQLSSEILYMALGSLLVVPMYAIGLEVYDRRVGLAAAALTAVFPALSAAVLHWGSLTEPAYMLCVYAGLWAGLLMLRPAFPRDREGSGAGPRADPWWAYPLAGLAFGLAYLTRPEAIGYWVIVAGFVVLLRVFRRLWSWRTLGLGLLYALAFGVAFGPYAYYTRQHTGSWMVSEKVGVAYLTGIGLAHGDTAAFDKATWGLDSTGLETFFFSSESYNVSMLGLIRADPRTFATVLYLNASRFVRVLIDWTLFPYVMLPLVVLGLFARGWDRERTLKEAYLVASMLPVASFVLFFIQARYLVAVIPVLILWMAGGLVEFSDWLIGTVVELRSPPARAGAGEGRPYWHLPRRWRGVLEVGPVAIVAVGLLLIQPRVVSLVTDTGSVRWEHRTVGEYLRARLSRDTVLMSRYPAIAFHADTRWIPTPNASWPEILNYARHKGVRYWAIDERELRYRPQLKDLVMGGQVPPELKLYYEDASGGERLVVYALSD
jgi:4-amino-4-deoxy-L-arabinose transferase-like glycosyltransferase